MLIFGGHDGNGGGLSAGDEVMRFVGFMCEAILRGRLNDLHSYDPQAGRSFADDQEMSLLFWA